MLGSKDKTSEARTEPANVPPKLSDLHCFTETDGVVTTSTYLLHLECRICGLWGRATGNIGMIISCLVLLAQPVYIIVNKFS